MADTRETVTTRENSGVDKTGAKVEQQSREVHSESSLDGRSTAANAVWYVFGFIAIVLGFRFTLKLFGANPAASFVDLVYSISGVLTAPFDNIFGVTAASAGQTKSVFEPSILVAMAVYALIAWGIVKLMNLNQRG